MSPKNTGVGSRVAGAGPGPFQEWKSRGGAFGKSGDAPLLGLVREAFATARESERLRDHRT